jgi:hypothetical protein
MPKPKGQSGRQPDEAVAWYCYMRLKVMIASGDTQKRIANLVGIPPSAMNLLVKSAKGVGPSTAAAFVKLFGFETRGQLVDAADAWWEKEGKLYALGEMRAMERERHARIKPDVGVEGGGGSSHPPRKRTA